MLQFCLPLLLTTGNIEVSYLAKYEVIQIWYQAITFASHLFVVAGKLDKGAVLKAICAGFKESTEPAVCLSDGTYFCSQYIKASLRWKFKLT